MRGDLEVIFEQYNRRKIDINITDCREITRLYFRDGFKKADLKSEI